MRRKYFGFAIAAIATLGPMQAWGGDREIAEQIIKQLKASRDSGALKDFSLDMKVDKGVVLFRGNVSQAAQKQLVLNAAQGIEGIASVVDEIGVTSAPASVLEPQAAAPGREQPLAAVTQPIAELEISELPGSDIEQASRQQDFSFRQALAAEAGRGSAGEILRTSAVEPSDDAQIVSAVVSALSQAKEDGQLRGFGVDVKSHNGVLQLSGRASSPSQRDAIIAIAESVPGVAGVREAISIPSAAPNLPRLPEPPSLQEVASQPLEPLPSHRLPQAGQGLLATPASAPLGGPTPLAPYHSQGGPIQAIPASVGAPIVGQPVPMAPYSAVGAPRYDSPNLPNYAWPGYAAYPNYAALTYPQQYSPSAWPYIGPFYPYPQVPLGWRRVSLEWDDGWWFLDFTDR
jgi:osmotically-inducible protein OsmY